MTTKKPKKKLRKGEQVWWTIALLCVTLCLSACDKPMNADDMAREIKRCRDAGLTPIAKQMMFPFLDDVTGIRCQP